MQQTHLTFSGFILCLQFSSLTKINKINKDVAVVVVVELPGFTKWITNDHEPRISSARGTIQKETFILHQYCANDPLSVNLFLFFTWRWDVFDFLTSSRPGSERLQRQIFMFSSEAGISNSLVDKACALNRSWVIYESETETLCQSQGASQIIKLTSSLKLSYPALRPSQIN